MTTPSLTEFNGFIHRSRIVGQLDVTLYRAAGPSHVDIFLHKLDTLLGRAKEQNPLRKRVSTNLEVEKGGHAHLVFDAMRSGCGNMDTLTLFSGLHDAGQHAFNELFAQAPGKGGGVAGAALAMAKGIPSELILSVDSVFSHSFADAHALYTYAIIKDPSSALAMAEQAKLARRVGGDFDVHSTYINSVDTSDTLLAVTQCLMFNFEVSEESLSLNQRALNTAIEGVGKWLIRHNVSPARSMALSEFLHTVTAGLSSASRATSSPTPVTPKNRGMRH